MAEADFTADAFRFQMHRMVKRAVDEIAPHHLNKKGKWGWVARELGMGHDRVRKAYGQRVKRIETHEFLSLADRFAALLQQWEKKCADRRQADREAVANSLSARASGAAARALAARNLAHVDGEASSYVHRRAHGGLGAADN